MGQQASFTKLKEQIEAAKRGLTEMSNAEIVSSPNNLPRLGLKDDPSLSSSPNIVKSELTKGNLDDLSRSESVGTKVVDMVSKTALSDTLITDHKPLDSSDALASDFQFFHRVKQPKGSSGLSSGLSSDVSGNIESEAVLFERLGRRIATLEGNVEQNRKYIHELIHLLSQLDLRQKSVNRKQQPVQRVNRRYLFWLVIGFLAVAWFGLTPSGHTAIQHLLAFI